jgi:hypothetical protein
MPGYSLVPVDYQPDFDSYSLVPVDYDPFADDTTQQAQAQPAQIQTQIAQARSQSPPAPAAAGQPNVGAPVIDGGPSGSQGADGPSPGGSDAGGRPNPIPDQAEASEPLPFSGYANPSPTESLVNRQKMDDQEEVIKTAPNAGRLIDGGELYKFVTTKLPIAEYPIDGGTGWLFTANSPFYAFDGTRYGTIDASPERPVTVTIKQDGTFTISRP